jgi:peptidylprolyl isomerase|eukprot:Stramenopile-MAST_4_protein_1024
MATMAKKGGLFCFLDVDVDDQIGRYANCKEFVKKKNLTYGLQSNRLSELQGSELARLPELFENDYDNAGKRMLVKLPNLRIKIKLWHDIAPLACENFRALCTGEKGKGKSGRPLHFKGSPFHRIVSGFVAQGGDISTGTGAGGESIFGKKFNDDKAGLKKKLNKRGLVAMCNTGKNTNTSQFFFTFVPCPKLDGKHVVFGEVVEGIDVLDAIEAAGSAGEGKPTVPVIIADCGVLEA